MFRVDQLLKYMDGHQWKYQLCKIHISDVERVLVSPIISLIGWSIALERHVNCWIIRSFQQRPLAIHTHLLGCGTFFPAQRAMAGSYIWDKNAFFTSSSTLLQPCRSSKAWVTPREGLWMLVDAVPKGEQFAAWWGACQLQTQQNVRNAKAPSLPFSFCSWTAAFAAIKSSFIFDLLVNRSSSIKWASGICST